MYSLFSKEILLYFYIHYINRSYTFSYKRCIKAYLYLPPKSIPISNIFVLLSLLPFSFENTFLTPMMKNLILLLITNHQTPLHSYKNLLLPNTFKSFREMFMENILIFNYTTWSIQLYIVDCFGIHPKEFCHWVVWIHEWRERYTLGLFDVTP